MNATAHMGLYYHVPPVLHNTNGSYCELMALEEDPLLQPGMDFRRPEYRREVFHRFYSFHLKHRSHPGCVYALMPWLAERFGWGIEEKLWFAYINGNTQHPITSLVIFRAFPDVHSLAEPKLDAWFNENFVRFGWDTDRRHQKAGFPAAVRDYRAHLAGRSQLDYFNELGGRGGESEYFQALWAEVRDTFLTFGRLSTFSYLEYLRIMGLPLDCNDLFLYDMSGSKSHRNGIAKVLGRDDLDWYDETPFNGDYAEGQVDWLGEAAEDLLTEADFRNAREPWARDVSYFTLESAFCTYKSWHRPRRRYPNCYVDMLWNRVRQMEERWPAEPIGVFWEARAELWPSHLLLEEQPFDLGLNPLKQNWYRNTGEVICMGRDDPTFENGYEREYWL